jgi:hypothetical protein
MATLARMGLSDRFSERVTAMIAYLVSEGRLLSLNASEWLVLLVGTMLCGSLMLLF